MERDHFGAPSPFKKPTTLSVEIARHLRDAIIRGELTAGEKVNESKITRELSLSRSPVREALRILEAQGLVTLVPHRGAHVRAVEDGRAALAAADLEGWHQAFLRFHDGLVALAANRHLTRPHEALKTSLRRYQISVIRPSGEPERFQVEHDAILDVIERGRIGRGAELVAAHVTNLKEALQKAIARTA